MGFRLTPPPRPSGFLDCLPLPPPPANAVILYMVCQAARIRPSRLKSRHFHVVKRACRVSSSKSQLARHHASRCTFAIVSMSAGLVPANTALVICSFKPGLSPPPRIIRGTYISCMSFHSRYGIESSTRLLTPCCSGKYYCIHDTTCCCRIGLQVALHNMPASLSLTLALERYEDHASLRQGHRNVPQVRLAPPAVHRPGGGLGVLQPSWSLRW